MPQGERVRELRKALKLTLEKFGERIGLKKNSLSQIENGKNALTDANIKLICREFNVSEEWLRSGEGEMFVEIDEEDELMAWAGRVLSDTDHSFQKKFVRMLMNLGEEEWRLLEKKVIELASDPEYLK